MDYLDLAASPRAASCSECWRWFREEVRGVIWAHVGMKAVVRLSLTKNESVTLSWESAQAVSDGEIAATMFHDCNFYDGSVNAHSSCGLEEDGARRGGCRRLGGCQRLVTTLDLAVQSLWRIGAVRASASKEEPRRPVLGRTQFSPRLSGTSIPHGHSACWSLVSTSTPR